MSAKAILPVEEIITPSGKVTLVHARIGSIVGHAPPATPKGFTPPGGFVAGIYAAPDNTVVGKDRDTHEFEEIDFTFQSITHTGKAGHKASLDNWAIEG